MNVVISDMHITLLSLTSLLLMFIKLLGPPQRSGNPTSYTKAWLWKHQSATDTKTSVDKDLVEKEHFLTVLILALWHYMCVNYVSTAELLHNW